MFKGDENYAIFKGEEIYENYGPLFFHSRRADRRDRLKKQYW